MAKSKTKEKEWVGKMFQYSRSQKCGRMSPKSKWFFPLWALKSYEGLNFGDKNANSKLDPN